MEELVKALEDWMTVKKALDRAHKASGGGGKWDVSIACMVMDYVAGINGKNPVEFIDEEIRPAVAEVNKEIGAILI